VLSERALEEEEVDVFLSEFRDTPVAQAESIYNEAKSGQISISSFVPRSRRYYERLVGAYDNSTSISEYAAGNGRTLFEQLSAWRPYDGFMLSLYLASHSTLTVEINIDTLSTEDLERALNFLVKHGDRTSQLGAIEVGLRAFPSKPEIEPILIRLVEQIRDDDVDGKDSGFKLFSALFIAIDSELSKIRLFTSEPTFYRRLAVMSQAALVHRQLVNSGVEIDSLYEWALSNHGGQYYMQSFADMRVEPRWDPNFAEPSQIKAHFISRIMFAANNYQQNIEGSKLYDLILGTNSESLYPSDNFLSLFFPGPLDGAEKSTNDLPDQISEIVEAQLGTEEVGPLSFAALVNSARIFHVGSDKADLAAKVLRHSSYRLANLEARTQLISILYGLAAVAAVTRSYMLADELRILVRVYRRDAQYSLSSEEAMRICLVAASSRANLSEWRDYVGDCFTELAFGDLKADDGKILHSHLQYLCHAVPEIWVSCGRADAALMAYNAMQ
jgi:hypothetical protein